MAVNKNIICKNCQIQGQYTKKSDVYILKTNLKMKNFKNYITGNSRKNIKYLRKNLKMCRNYTPRTINTVE